MYVKVRFITHYLNEYLEKFIQMQHYCKNNLYSFALCIVYCSRFV